MSSEELVNIATNVDTYLRYLATPGQTRFVAPSRKLGGAPYPLEADLIVHVDSVPTTIPWAYDANSSEIVLSNGLMAGALVEIWRRTEVDESLVEFPVAQKWLPKDNNKSMTQLLMCIQEVWGGLKELDGGITTRLQTLSDTVDAAMESLRDYVNNAIASVFEISGVSGATWSSTVAAGDTYLDTPYVFNQGILMVGGSMYNLSNPDHATLSVVGNHTRITFTNPILTDHEVILMVFSSTEATTFDYSGLNASTYSASWSAGDTTLLVPFVFTRGILILGGVTYDFSSPGHGVTLTDVGGVSTLITLDTAPVVDHECIVVMFSEPS